MLGPFPQFSKTGERRYQIPEIAQLERKVPDQDMIFLNNKDNLFMRTQRMRNFRCVTAVLHIE